MYDKMLQIIEEEKEAVKNRLHCTMPDFFIRGVIEYVTDLVTNEYFTEKILNDDTYTVDELITVLESKYRDLLQRIKIVLCYRGGKYDRAFDMTCMYLHYVYEGLIFYINNMEDDDDEKK